MKRALFALAVLGVLGAALLPDAVRSQPGKGVPFGPDEKGATLRAPWETVPAAAPRPPSSGAANYVQGLFKDTAPPTTSANLLPTAHSSLLPYDTTGINNDILVTPEVGPWMVLINSYAGKEGPMRARKMVTELRSIYKLHAYVFNYGADDKRKELERVKAIVDKQKEDLRKRGMSVDQPIRVRHLRIDEHCGVLVGGYPTPEAAAAARDFISKLKPPDPDVFMIQKPGDLLDIKFVTPEGNDKGQPQAAYVNPFKRAFPVHNPTMKLERPADAGKVDVEALRRMNRDEEYSLLTCKKSCTLVVKQFSVTTITAPRGDVPASGFWNALSFGKKNDDTIDFPAKSAHEVAVGLRKWKLEAYVLHTKYYSVVTIGGFDGPNDPNLRAMQSLIQTKLNPQVQALGLLDQPQPMLVPH